MHVDQIDHDETTSGFDDSVPGLQLLGNPGRAFLRLFSIINLFPFQAQLNPEQAKILANLAKSCYPELGLPEDSDLLLRTVKNEITYTEDDVVSGRLFFSLVEV